MVDLHTHILPEIDDGAKSLEVSLQLLQAEQENGVDTVALTPHYVPDEEPVEEFVARRSESLQRLTAAYDGSVKFVLAAEVMYSGDLLERDLQPLCYAGTDTILIELLPQYYPPEFEQTLFRIRSMGYLPVIAHVDRYPFILHNPRLLYDWVSSGCYCHVNAGGLQHNKKILQFVKAGIRHDLIHAIASDTHSVHNRPPNVKSAYAVLEKQLGHDEVLRLQQNAEMLVTGKKPEIDPTPIKNGLFGLK